MIAGRRAYLDRRKDAFACQQAPGDTDRVNHNRHITDELEKLAEINKNLQDKWRAFAYEKACRALRSYAPSSMIGCRAQGAVTICSA